MGVHQQKSAAVVFRKPRVELYDRCTVEEAIRRSQDYLLNEQRPEGYWWFELESNATITAEYLMMLRFMGISTPSKEKKIVNYLLSRQNENGSWSLYYEDGGELNATIESYFALKLAGLSSEAEPMTKARGYILAHGGIGKARIFTKIFLAMFGQFEWRGIPALPVEIILLPSWSPFTVYDFSSWSRSTLIPLSIILDKKPVKPIPSSSGVKELYLSSEEIPRSYSIEGLPFLSWKRFFINLNRILKGFEESRLRIARKKAIRETEAWILEHQEESGDWGGIQPAMVNSLLALSCLGYPNDHPVIRKGLWALERFVIEGPDQLVLQSCISPVWDTALTIRALIGSGVAPTDKAIQKGLKWLVERQILKGGDWQVKNPRLKPGGWAFEFDNDHYPDVDDSAVVLMALKEGGMERQPEGHPAIQRGLEWVLGMQSRDGGWGAFDTDNNKAILNEIPFADLEAMLDPSTADVTGRVLEMMGVYGYGKDHPAARRAIRFIRKEQEDDGCWWGRWGVNYIYGTWSVLSGLASIGVDPKEGWISRSLEWLKMRQNPDGGWGESCKTYEDPRLRGEGPSTASQTAWATMALMAAGDRGSSGLTRGILYLLDTQRADGKWEEPYFTGTGFPKYFYLKYHGYRNFFPLMALGRYNSLVHKGR